MGAPLAWAPGRRRWAQGKHARLLTRMGPPAGAQVLPQVGLTDNAFATGARLLPDGGAAAAAERDAAFLVGGGSREYRDGRSAGLAALEAEAAGAGGGAGLEARLDPGAGAERGAGADELLLPRLQARPAHGYRIWVRVSVGVVGYVVKEYPSPSTQLAPSW